MGVLQALADPCLTSDRNHHRAPSQPARSSACPHRLSAHTTQNAPQNVLRGRKQLSRRVAAAAAKVETSSSSTSTSNGSNGTDAEDEQYEVYLTKPLGVRFARGNDGGIYVTRSDSSLGSTDPRIKPGDQIKLVSASFGDDIWKAENFGQVMYAIKTRNGQVYLKMRDAGGDMSVFEEIKMTEQEKMWRAERAGGNYGAGTKERQAANYVQRQELDKKRRQLFEQALAKFKKNEVQGALMDFEEVISLEPRKYLGDDFSRFTQVFRAAQYNVACCYASINQVDAGLEAIDQAMASGFEQFGQIRSDPNLEPLRKSPKFKDIINKYDEPVFNDGAIKALKGLFGWGKKEEE